MPRCIACMIPIPPLPSRRTAAPERPHGHAKAQNNLVDEQWVRAHVHKHARCHCVWEEDTVDSKAGAVSNHHWRLFYHRAQRQSVQQHLRGVSRAKQ
eukprot:366229-Chlamydomonas_euryale.AAC.64